MILQFTVSNFRAFRETQTLNFAATKADKTLQENCIPAELPGLKGQQWLKGVALYGPNASGKSSVIEALQALGNMVRKSAKTTDPKDQIEQIEPFALSPGNSEEPTAFGVVFVSEGMRYEYRVAATKEHIWHESLRAFPTAKEQMWFCRDWQPDEQAYKWTPEKPTGYRRDVKKEEFTLPNVLFLSKAISLGDTQLEPVFRWFKERLQFIDLSTRFGGVGLGVATAKAIFKNNSQCPRIVELLRHADFGVESVAVREEKPTEEVISFLERMKDMLPDGAVDDPKKMMVPKVELAHRIRGHNPVLLPWESESAGTHRFFELAGPWLNILEKGYTVCIDELETSMHPLLVMELLRLLFSDANQKGAQVIFTTHNALLLDQTLLRRDQVWFVDKDDCGEAHLYPLTDYAPRKGESLVRGYLSGRYGAVPFIPAGLLGTLPSRKTTQVGANEQ
ncbi:MAG TPA: ATP-binding protein [Abditibacteriaceae bacterium]|jgi:hypothetical protein